jgi:phosphoribosylformylglycinamidine synthase
MAFHSCHLHHIYSSIFAVQKPDQMIYHVAINVMPLKDLLDPQGKAVMGGLHNLGLTSIQDVRIGKRITIEIESTSAEAATKIAEEAASKLLANQVMEHFEITVL